MSIQIKDIISHEYFADIELITGEKGLDNTVKSIGIIDNFNPVYDYDRFFHSHNFLDNELILSTYFLDWTLDVQIMCIKFLKKAGASGLFIICPGLFPKNIDESIAKIAMELDFPVAVLPEEKCSYSQIITNVMSLVLDNTEISYNQFNYVMSKLVKLPESDRTVDALLTNLSNYTNLVIALYDQNFNILNIAVPKGKEDSIFNDESLKTIFLTANNGTGTYVSLSNKEYYYMVNRIPFKNMIFKQLLFISDKGPISQHMQSWVMHIMHLFLTMWGEYEQGTDALAQSILKNEVIKSEMLSKTLGIELGNIRTLLICKQIKKSHKVSRDNYIESLNKYFEQQKLRIISYKSEDNIVVFLESNVYKLDINELSKYLTEDLSFNKQDIHFILFQNSNLTNHSKAQELYNLFIDNIDYSIKIFPNEKFYNESKLLFVQNCVEVVHNGQKSIQKALLPLEPLISDQKWHQELIETLSAYYLDSNGNLNDTAELLYVHNSTIKYRINKSNEILGYDIRKTPESHLLLTALAVNRLLGFK